MSCGTDAGVSVPCIFSGLGRANYYLKALTERDVLDLVQRIGLDVLMSRPGWLQRNLRARADVDRHLLEGHTLWATANATTKSFSTGSTSGSPRCATSSIIVLHMMGGQPPLQARSRKLRALPAGLRDLAILRGPARASRSSTATTTITYTDHVLSRADLGSSQDIKQPDTMMLYVSDHGKSLGQTGCTCTPMPYVLAPRQQKHVPMVMWAVAGRAPSLGAAEGLRRQFTPQGAVDATTCFTRCSACIASETSGLRREPRIFPAPVPRSQGDMGLQPRDFGKRRKVIGSPLKHCLRGSSAGRIETS